MREDAVGWLASLVLMSAALLTVLIAAPAAEVWSASPPTPTPLLLPPWPAATSLPQGNPPQLAPQPYHEYTQPTSTPGNFRLFLPLMLKSSRISDSEFTISAAAEYQSAPAIWDHIVVWQDSRSRRDDDIYGYDLQNGSEFTITTASGSQSQPAIWEHIVVWQDNRHGNWDIYGYDLDRHTEFPVHVGPGNQQDPAVFGDVVVWHDNRNGNWDIYGYNRRTQTEFPVIVAPSDQLYPAIWNNRVVWGDGRNGGYDFNIRGLDLSTGQEFVVTDAPMSQDRPAIWENIVVWQDWRNWRMDIYGKDLATGQEFAISQAPADEFVPTIWGDLVVWEDRGCHNGDIYGYYLPSQVRFPVVTAPLPQTAPTVWGDVIVWQDNRRGVLDIYGYRWTGSPPPNPPIVLSPPTDLQVGGFPGGQVQVRWSYTGSDHLGFRVERSSGFTPGEYTTVATLGPDLRSYTEQPPVLEETYWYRVRAYNATGQSDYCNEAYTATFEDAPNQDERYLLLLINEARADPAYAGYPQYSPRPPMAHNQLLNYAARSHSQAILNSGFRIGHCDLIGRCPTERARAVGYEGGVAENLIAGLDGPDWVESSHRAFMGSQGHRDNLMCECFNEAGLGHTYDPAKGDDYWHGQYTETFSGRSGVTIPNLPTGIVVPYTGTVFTTFAYIVNYYHSGGLAPRQATVYIDGISHAMALRSGQPANGTYRYTTTLPAGFARTYHFTFQFPGGAARLPETGDYHGPGVWPDQADLAVRSADIGTDPSEPRAGYAAMLRALIRNEGTSAATDVAVRFLADGQPIGEVILARVEAGSGTEARITWTPASVGQVSVEVQVDPANTIPEWQENNNRASRTITVISPRTWYVDCAVAQSGDGTTPQTPFRTIQEGLAAARAGDRVSVAAGTYQERVSIPGQVRLVGAGAAVTTIHGDGNDSVVHIAPGGLIEGFTITGSGPGYFDSGIWHSQGTVTVRRNRFVGNNVGIFSWCFQEDCAALLIAENNVFVGNSRVAVDANGPPVHRLVNNTVVGNGRGFVLNNLASLAENNIVCSVS
jgi:beta propeller repeat protein